MTTWHLDRSQSQGQDPSLRLRISLASRWANHKPNRWWKHASPKARSRLHQRSYSAEHNAALAFQRLLRPQTWKRHSAPWSKGDRAYERRQQRRFIYQHKGTFVNGSEALTTD